MKKKKYQIPSVNVVTVDISHLMAGSDPELPSRQETDIAGSDETPPGGWGPGNSYNRNRTCESKSCF